MSYEEPDLQEYRHPTWGYTSVPEIAADYLYLEKYLAYLPEDGVVVDVGAGEALSLAKMVHLLRPDATVISVDPGFALFDNRQEFMDGIAKDLIELEPDQQQVLKASDAWYQNVVAGFGEALPLLDETVDMVVSYAAVPEYMRSIEMTFDECIRILRENGVGIFGPMSGSVFGEWNEIAERGFDNEQCRAYDLRIEWMRSASTGSPMEVAITTFVK